MKPKDWFAKWLDSLPEPEIATGLDKLQVDDMAKQSKENKRT
tara:strand:- start:729 stop:854 length:126 start_codon:yes stop_codon:yes gene_type:complete